jgi:hypothetical protein
MLSKCLDDFKNKIYRPKVFTLGLAVMPVHFIFNFKPQGT